MKETSESRKTLESDIKTKQSRLEAQDQQITALQKEIDDFSNKSDGKIKELEAQV